MKRTFNYTGRSRILREHVNMTLTSDDDGYVLDADVDLSALMLPDDASIRIELYDRLGMATVHAGTVATPAYPRGYRVPASRFVGSIKGRVKVVDTSGEFGKILAIADKLPIANVGGDTESLLPIQRDKLDGEIWRVDFDDHDDGPVLKYEAALEADGIGDHVRGPEFLALVYPAALRTILIRMFHEGWLADEGDLDGDTTWRDNWRAFASGLVGDWFPPGGDLEDAEAYVNETATAFCARIEAVNQYQQVLQGGEV